MDDRRANILFSTMLSRLIQRRSSGLGHGTADTSTEVAVSVRNLEKTYNNDVTAVNDVSFDIERGTAVGVLGPNGAGKTTLIKTILSLVVPTDGSITVEGIDVQDRPSAAFHRIGAMLEGARNTYWRLTVKENLEYFSVIGGKDYRKRQDRIDELLAQFDLSPKADTPVRELSRGQKQKVSLAATLARDADVLFLDEPTLGLDIESSLELRRELKKLIGSEGTTVVLTSHDMDVIQDVCNRVIILNDGNVVTDDTIENLTEIFDAQTYTVTIDTVVAEEDIRHLRSKFDVTKVTFNEDMTNIEIRIADGDFHRFTNLLSELNLPVNDMSSTETNLEEIFLSVTTTGVRHEAASARPEFGQG